MSEARTIRAMGVGNRKEYVAAGATGVAVIDPGDLVVLDSDGKVARNAVAGAKVMPMVAIENELFGVAIYNAGVIVSYKGGDRVSTETAKTGDELRLTVAAGAGAIAVGDPLSAAADGTVVKASGVGIVGVIAYAQEAVDNSGGATKTHIRAAIA